MFIDIRDIINTYVWVSKRVLIAFLQNGAIFIAIKYTNGIFEVVSEFCDRLKLLLHVCCTRQSIKQKAPVCIYHPNRCIYNIVMRFFSWIQHKFFSHIVIIHYITPQKKRAINYSLTQFVLLLYTFCFVEIKM